MPMPLTAAWETFYERYYARSHSHIESDMEGWVMRFDDSLDQAPLIR
jgi:hypothetical protein